MKRIRAAVAGGLLLLAMFGFAYSNLGGSGLALA
jgi:hypothetical protein